MEYYARFKVYREVQETVRYLAMACRLDEYTNLSEQEKRASIGTTSEGMYSSMVTESSSWRIMHPMRPGK